MTGTAFSIGEAIRVRVESLGMSKAEVTSRFDMTPANIPKLRDSIIFIKTSNRIAARHNAWHGYAQTIQ
jgi:hypothetical protein